MAAQEPIRLHIDLPHNALETLSALLERAERLLIPAADLQERGENTGFDPQLFQKRIDEMRNPESPSPDTPIPAFSTLQKPDTAVGTAESSLTAQSTVLPAGSEPDAPAYRAQPPSDISQESAAAKAAVEPELPDIAAAGFSVERELPHPAGWKASIAEELSQNGSAPLTAQAVSLAFQQDERRYDNGFPLY